MRLIIILLTSTILYGQNIGSELNLNKVVSKDLIDSIINNYHFKSTEPGISILIVKDGKDFYKKNIGLSNKKKNIAITDSTIFNLGSVTKQFTAYCIFKLEEEKKLSMHDSIQKYLPELPSFGHTITLYHLVTHTSGIPDYLEVLSFKNQFKTKRLRSNYMLAFFKRYHELSFIPGESFSYSNTGYMLLCEIVERVSGLSIEDYSMQNIFTPLQMKSARFTFNESDGLPDGTQSFYLSKNKFKVHKSVQPNAMGATGIFCNLEDFKKWDLNLFQPNEASKNIVNKMLQRTYLNNGSLNGYGGGIILKPYKGFLSEEHSGGWNSFLVQFRRIPEINLSIYIASTCVDYPIFKICDQLTDLFIPSNPMININIVSPNHNTSELLGRYIEDNNLLWNISVKNDSLVITSYADTNKIVRTLYVFNANPNQLQCLDDKNDTLSFELKNGKVTGFFYEGASYFRYKRFYKKLEPSNYDLAIVNGKFKSNTLQYQFRVKAKKLKNVKIKPYFFIQYKLDHLGDHVYKLRNEPIYFRFYRDYVSVGNEWTSNIVLRRK